MSKDSVGNHLGTLKTALTSSLGPDKESILRRVKAAVAQGGEAEGKFVKLFLSEVLHRVFGDGVVIEGMDSMGRTQFKRTFFGAKPAPDFVIERLSIVGEVKFAPLTSGRLATAIGQVLVYVAASKMESVQYEYGCLLYFDTAANSVRLTQEETDFARRLWQNDGIYLIFV